MRHELFEERRAIESISHRERIRILQEAEDCIQAATNFREYRACERQESKARKALRARLQPRLRAFRAKMRTYRILHREAGRHPSSLPDER
ncbi:MAG: hypothetical protein D6721_04015 [Gammaproteobacteria bacterium]|nr:MAG: hypothetical protein D6721_04015 [Gammaproteobacteria bacterium]